MCEKGKVCAQVHAHGSVWGGFLLKKAAEPSWGKARGGKQGERGRDRAKSPIYLSRRAAAVHEKSLCSSGPGRLEGLR